MSTIEIVRADLAAFMHTYGLENEHTLAIAKLAEFIEKWLHPDENSQFFNELWKNYYTLHKLQIEAEPLHS